MSWENDAVGYLAELSRSPGARQPATLGEAWDSEWKRGGLDTIYGVEKPFNDARDEFVAAIEGVAGMPIKDYAAARGIRADTAITPAQHQALLGQIADTLPEEARKKLEPLRDIRLNAARKAQKIEADAEEVSNATYGLSAHATAFIAGVARQSVDPVNLIAMAVSGPVGGGARAGLLATVGREALANAGAQAVVEPAIEPARAELGLEHGFGRAAGNVLEAGIGGGVLSGMFHLAGRGLRALRSPPERVAPEGTIAMPAPENRAAESASAPAARPEPVPAGPVVPARPAEQFAPDDFHAAGDLAARDHVIDAMSPVDTAEGRIEHAARVDAAAARIETGRGVVASQPAPDLTVAVRLPDGTIRTGNPYQVHADLYTRAELDGEVGRSINELSSGYVTPEGRYLTKKEALQYVEETNPSLTVGQGGALESVNYKNAIREQRAAESAAARKVADDIVTTEIKAMVPRGRAAADPATFSLYEHLASVGGLRPDPELVAIFGNRRGPFVPGFGSLIRQGGKTIDDALKSAKEAGYLFDPHDAGNGTAGISGRVGLGLIQRDLLDMLDAENRGRKVYKAGHLPPEKFDAAAEEHAILGALDKELHDTGGAAVTDPVIAHRVVEIVQREGETDVLAAYERAIMEDAERYEGLAAARAKDAELAKIPGWDPDEPGAASRDGAADTGQRGQAERAGQKAGGTDGQPSRAASESAGAPRQLGDPALAADAALAIEEAGGDLEITLQNPDGTTRTLKASDALREVEDDARAADELNACIAGAAEEAPF